MFLNRNHSYCHAYCYTPSVFSSLRSALHPVSSLSSRADWWLASSCCSHSCSKQRTQVIKSGGSLTVSAGTSTGATLGYENTQDRMRTGTSLVTFDRITAFSRGNIDTALFPDKYSVKGFNRRHYLCQNEDFQDHEILDDKVRREHAPSEAYPVSLRANTPLHVLPLAPACSPPVPDAVSRSHSDTVTFELIGTVMIGMKIHHREQLHRHSFAYDKETTDQSTATYCRRVGKYEWQTIRRYQGEAVPPIPHDHDC